MKKTYSAPTAQALLLHPESAMLAESTQTVTKDDTNTVGAGASLSNERAWSNPIWGSSDED